ncbi:MAG: hypothetical protein KKA90_04450 [Nanoarchaeota archaeon]|nr:hypothetical protein [Nanoarchaeota archaeon]
MNGPKLWLVIAAVVGLVAGILLITAFVQTRNMYRAVSQDETVCRTQAMSSCQVAKELPATWFIKTIKKTLSCAEVTGIGSCADLDI